MIMDRENNNYEEDKDLEDLTFHKEPMEDLESFQDFDSDNFDSDIEDEKNRKKKKKRGFKGSLFSYLLVVIIGGLLGGIVAPYFTSSIYGSILPNPNGDIKDGLTSSLVINPKDEISNVTAVVKKAMPSVVGITTVEERQVWMSLMDVEGIGSGVIVHPDGYILTNAHVVAGNNVKSITVLFEDGDKLAGRVLWMDTNLDLAVVKVDAKNLPTADLGDSDQLEVGELAVAIGNPLGMEFQRTVTSGIISGLNRAIQVEGKAFIENLIQTDASINPGNSGGPLLNSKGEVIGINTAKIKTGEGLGFSIPINGVKPIIKDVIEKGSYNKDGDLVFFGVSVLDVGYYQAALGVDLGIEKGVIILSVDPDSPASRAGLMPHDVILEIDGEEIDLNTRIVDLLKKYKKDDKAKIKILRNYQEVEIDVVFNELR